jgi:hypothetical protein
MSPAKYQLVLSNYQSGLWIVQLSAPEVISIHVLSRRLDANKLTTLTPYTLLGLSSLSALDLSDNPGLAAAQSGSAFGPLFALQTIRIVNTGLSCEWALDPFGGDAPPDLQCIENEQSPVNQ